MDKLQDSTITSDGATWSLSAGSSTGVYSTIRKDGQATVLCISGKDRARLVDGELHIIGAGISAYDVLKEVLEVVAPCLGVK